MFGRMICSKISQRIRYMTLTVWMGLTATHAYLPVIVASTALPLAFLTCMTGVLVGGVFPTVLAHAANIHPGHVGAATGFMIAVCSIGGSAVPALVGVIADGFGMRLGAHHYPVHVNRGGSFGPRLGRPAPSRSII